MGRARAVLLEVLETVWSGVTRAERRFRGTVRSVGKELSRIRYTSQTNLPREVLSFAYSNVTTPRKICDRGEEQVTDQEIEIQVDNWLYSRLYAAMNNMTTAALTNLRV